MEELPHIPLPPRSLSSSKQQHQHCHNQHQQQQYFDDGGGSSSKSRAGGWSAFFKHSSDFCILVDAQWNIIQMNTSVLKHFRIKPSRKQELVGSNLKSLFLIPDAAQSTIEEAKQRHKSSPPHTTTPTRATQSSPALTTSFSSSSGASSFDSPVSSQAPSPTNEPIEFDTVYVNSPTISFAPFSLNSSSSSSSTSLSSYSSSSSSSGSDGVFPRIVSSTPSFSTRTERIRWRGYEIPNNEGWCLIAKAHKTNIHMYRKDDTSPEGDLLKKKKRRKENDEDTLDFQKHITETITNNVSSCLMMMDKQGFPTYLNPAAERATGFTLEELRKRNDSLHSAIHHTHTDGTPYPIWTCPIDQSLENLEPLQNYRDDFIRKDGTFFPVICAVAPLSKKGERVGAVLEFRDITEDVRAEQQKIAALEKAKDEQRRRAQEALEYQKRQDVFIDTICHEIRNPMQGIIGNVSFIGEEIQALELILQSLQTPLDANHTKQQYEMIKSHIIELRSCADAIANCAQHQKVITNDVLSISKLEANRFDLNMTWFDPKELVRKVAAMFKSQVASKTLEFVVDFEAGEEEFVFGDKDRLAQILINLVANSVRFTHQGGIKLIGTIVKRSESGHRRKRQKISSEDFFDSAGSLSFFSSADSFSKKQSCENLPTAFSDLREDIELSFTIEDTGIGMTKEEINVLFDRFSQVKNIAREYGGSGLGLVISKALVKQMGGNSIIVESEKWKGSKFSFHVKSQLPTESEQINLKSSVREAIPIRSSPEPASKIPTSQEEPCQFNSRKNVLIVEDNEINLRVLTRYLTNVNMSFACGKNGSEAVNLIQNRAQNKEESFFDVILMDIVMPVMNGIEATRVIRDMESKGQLPSKSIPIIGLSGNARQENIEEAFSAGMSDYITKPYCKEVIISKIKEWTRD